MPYKWWENEGVIRHPKHFMLDSDRYLNPINNILLAVRSTMNLPKKVKIEDDTLREGIECPGGLWNRTQRETQVKIAKTLQEAGVKEIHIGMPATDPFAQELVKALQDETPELKLVAHIRADKEYIDKTLEHGVDMGWMLFPVDDYRIKQRNPWCRTDTETHIVEDLCDRISMGVEYAKERGVYIRAGVSSPVVAPLNRLVSVYKAAYEAGADGTTVMDGYGINIPEATKFLTSIALSIFGPNKDIETHCHDDYGLAMANTAAFVSAGGNVVDCAVNGLGDRGGQASLEQIIPVLEILYGIDTGVDMTKLLGLSKLVEELYGIPVQPNKGISGENCYVHEEDPHIAAILRADGEWWGDNAINPEYLGAKQYLHWGASSLHKGPNSCTALKISQMGFTYNEKQLDEVLERIIEIAKKNRYATEEEVEKIIKDVYKESL